LITDQGDRLAFASRDKPGNGDVTTDSQTLTLPQAPYPPAVHHVDKLDGRGLEKEG